MANMEEQMEEAKDRCVKIDAKQFGGRFEGKPEVYKFMTHEVGAYLPPVQW